MDILVPDTKYNELEAFMSCMEISESGTAKGIVLFNNIEYVITGSSSQHGVYQYFMGNRVVDLARYTGTLKPLPNAEHQIEVNFERRERGNTGLLIKCGNRQLVMLEKVHFINSGSGVQSSLF